MRIERFIFAVVIFSALSATVSACPECRARVAGGIYNQDFSANLLIILLPIFVLTILGVGLYFADKITEKFREKTAEWLTKKHALR